MATAQMSGRHYYISQKRTFMAVQKHIWDILLNFTFSMEDLYKKIVSFLYNRLSAIDDYLKDSLNTIQ